MTGTVSYKSKEHMMKSNLKENIIKIAFAGEQGAGKTTAAHAVRKVIRDTDIIKLARPIYNYVFELEKPRDDVKRRLFIQELRDLTRKRFGDDCLTRAFFNSWYRSVQSYNTECTVCDDLQYPLEERFLRNMEFTIVKIVCDYNMRRNRLGVLFCNDTHSSETSLIVPDFSIENNGNKKEFQEKVRLMIENILKKQ